jgi:hypothetical protein
MLIFWEISPHAYPILVVATALPSRKFGKLILVETQEMLLVLMKKAIVVLIVIAHHISNLIWIFTLKEGQKIPEDLAA